MINPGKYKAKATEAHLDQSKKGTDYIAVAFKLEGYPEELTWYGYLTEKTEDRTMKSLRTCGWTGNDIGTAESIDGASLPNRVELVIEHDAYEGKTRAKVQWINALGGARAPATLDKAALAKRLAAKARTIVADDAGDDAEIPFLGSARRDGGPYAVYFGPSRDRSVAAWLPCVPAQGTEQDPFLGVEWMQGCDGGRSHDR